MKLRCATLKDLDSIASLHAESWRVAYGAVLSAQYLDEEALAERQLVWRDRLSMPRPNQTVVVAELGGHIVGFACAFADHDSGWGSYLDNLHVRQQHQGNGIGRALIQDVAHYCKAKCAEGGLYLSVNQNNVRAQRFYLALGARNATHGVWNAPDGSVVSTFRFAWDTAALSRMAADISFHRTGASCVCPGW
jgi:ribosomal protein S18 acetylase RimI-like enzyme